MSTNPSTDNTPDHLRYEATQLEKMRRQILSDMDSLREQENNLRAYEARLRDSHSPIPQPAPAAATATPFAGRVGVGAAAGSLEGEWEKLQRSRTLLEAERRAFTDERTELREKQANLVQREEALRQREAWVEIREKELAAKAMPAPVPAKPTSHSPFEMARNLFSMKRAG
jgi:hypothetical protein